MENVHKFLVQPIQGLAESLTDEDGDEIEEIIDEESNTEIVVHRNKVSFLLEHVKMIEAPTENEAIVFEKLGLRGVTFVLDKENNKFVIEYNYEKFNKVWEEFLNLDRLGI